MNKKTKLLILEIIGLIIAIIIGIWVYMVSSTYEFNQNKSGAINEYFEKNTVNILEYNGNDEWFLNIPYEVINKEISYRYEKELQNKGIEFEGLGTDIKNNEIKANIKVGSTYIPVNFKVKKFSINEKNKEVNLKISPNSFTKSELVFPAFIDSIILGKLMNGIDLKITFDEFDISKHVEIKKILNTKENIMISIDIDTKILDDYINIIRENLTKEEETYYRTNTLETQKALKWIYNYKTIPMEVKKEFIKDFIDEATSLKELLALLPIDKLEQLYKELPIIGEKIKYLEVIKLRTNLIGSLLEKDIDEVLECVKDIKATKNFVFCRNIPFGIDDLRIIDASYINETYNLDMKKDLIESLKIVQWEKEVAVMYDTKEGIFIAFTNNKYIPITKEVYEKEYKTEKLEDGELTKNKEIYTKINEAIKKEYGDEVFYRYLKNDNKEAFAIVSKSIDYQEYKIVLLRDFKVLTDEYTTLEEINNAYPNFNLKLATNIMNEVELEYVNWSTRKKLIENLKQAGYVKEDGKIIFCSYDGKRYISLKTNDGGKYVYTLYRGIYLEGLYTYDRAKQKFKDIPQMILLQDIPE